MLPVVSVKQDLLSLPCAEGRPQGGETNTCDFLVIYSLSCQMQCDLSCLFLCKGIYDILQCRLTSYLVLPKVLQISRISKSHLDSVMFFFRSDPSTLSNVSISSYTTVSLSLLLFAGKKRRDERFLLYLAYVNFTIFLSQKNRDPPLGL